ncbi:hypothetical protein ACVRZ3_04605 [Streptococcus devriesei]
MAADLPPVTNAAVLRHKNPFFCSHIKQKKGVVMIQNFSYSKQALKGLFFLCHTDKQVFSIVIFS